MSGAPLTQQSSPRHPATIVQSRAAHPQQSVWVGASAGTGKTKVLIDRVLRLMLPRVDASGIVAPATQPSRILCLTFTKTAAAEMSNRIYAVLGRWSVMEDAQLASALEDLTGLAPVPDMMAAARRLFAQVLDAPGGLKIMTIHSFCQSVLKRFPIEAGLAPHFTLLDELTAQDMLTSCLHNLIAHARIGDDDALAHAFRHLSLRLNAEDMTDTLQKMMGSRARLTKLLTHHGDNGHSAIRTVDAVYKRLDLKRGDTPESIEGDIIALHQQDEDNLRALLRTIIDVGTDTEKERAQGLQAFLERVGDARLGVIDDYVSFFLTGDGDIRKKAPTKKVAETLPVGAEAFLREGERLMAINERIKAARLAEGTGALLTIAADMLGRYEDAKKSRDALDFDDLILRTSALLAGAGSAEWVLYKLDEGVDHILVDEAQDTSPAQWDVVAALAEEFFVGQGSRDDVVRTLFVVGDEKQSIFSFQGADPAAFHRMKAHFARHAEAVQGEFAIDLEYSFRSTASVLSLVDGIFNRAEAKSGVVFDTARDVVHLPFRAGDAGHVELWPLIEQAEAAPRSGWEPPVSAGNVDNALARLAQQIAETISGWIESREILPAKGRPIRAGDVLILVQSRGEIVERLMRALKSLDIPVAGADRMKLRQEIAIMDMLAAARFGLQPRDDLTLAALLKSPLVGISEEELFDLCHPRGNKTVWSHLHDVRPDLVAWLQPLVATAGRATPYEFFAALLAMPCPGDAISGRRAFYGRLGRDVADALDEFLNSCLSYEQSHIPAVEMFVDWFARNESDIKREQDAAGIDQVRIMTVHASKGLQAPIVFLPDTAKVMHAHNKGRIRLLWPEEGSDDIALWAASSADETALYKARYQNVAARQDDEYRRLLYVALTRAEDRLYICGYKNKKEPAEKCWYNLVAPAFSHIEPDAHGIRAINQPQQKPVKPVSETAVSEAITPVALPDWLRVAAAEEGALAKPLAPSRPGEDEPAVKSPLDADNSQRFARGIILHRLLEMLPALPRGKWPAAMQTYLARPAFALDDATQTAYAQEIMGVLDHPDFADIFGPAARAEVPLVGLAGSGEGAVVLAGQVDRLLVRGDEVLVVDYKTNRPPPSDVKDVPVIYLKQMAAYQAILHRIYPGKTIKCALLWTDALRLMPLPQELLAPYSPA